MTADSETAKVGRPPLYADPLVLEAKIDQYFDQLAGPPTVPDLCLFLGFTSRQSFLDYEKRDEFSCTIKKARLTIEADRAAKLLSKDHPTAGIIFDLTNNHGWKNPQHLKHSGDDDPDAKPIQTITRVEIIGVKPRHDHGPEVTDQ